MEMNFSCDVTSHITFFDDDNVEGTLDECRSADAKSTIPWAMNNCIHSTPTKFEFILLTIEFMGIHSLEGNFSPLTASRLSS